MAQNTNLSRQDSWGKSLNSIQNKNADGENQRGCDLVYLLSEPICILIIYYLYLRNVGIGQSKSFIYFWKVFVSFMFNSSRCSNLDFHLIFLLWLMLCWLALTWYFLMLSGNHNRISKRDFYLWITILDIIILYFQIIVVWSLTD